MQLRLPLFAVSRALLACVAADPPARAEDATPAAAAAPAGEKIKALIIDGQNNHDWKKTTPLLKAMLEQTGRFTVDVATTPQDGNMAAFKPSFRDYGVVVSNFNGSKDTGAAWPDETQRAFEEFVKNGGGFVPVHAANNAFPEWAEYNKMIGVGGWAGRDERSRPYLRLRDGKFVHDTTAGVGGSHGLHHEFVVETRDAEHPITKGLPAKWMHAGDELYDRLRGPAERVTVLATAFAAKEKGGSGEHEPLLMVIGYGKGRVFHTALGHDEPSMKCAGFIATLTRGAEWAATGKVTLPVPADFPTADKVLVRELRTTPRLNGRLGALVAALDVRA